MMKKIFLFLIIAGAIGVFGTGVLDNIITVDTQEISKFEGAETFNNFNCACDDPNNPSASCNVANLADMSCGP